MFCLGLTGSIATGKSTALAVFAQLGIPICSADELVHQLYQGKAVAPIEAIFPGVTHDGHVDRKKLSAYLIENPEKLSDLEAIVHPLVKVGILAFLENAKQSSAQMAVLELPLLFETKNTYPIDAIAVTTCSDAEQRRRALQRDGMTIAKLETILARQMPQSEKKKRADFIIETDCGLEASHKMIETIVKTCVQRNKEKAK